MKNSCLFFLSTSFFVFTIFSALSLPLPKYGLVYGSDANLSDANREILRFNSKKIDLIQYRGKASMFRRVRKYRSVLLFNTEKEAKDALSRVEPYLTTIDRQALTTDPNWSRGSFIVNLSAWCPKWYSRAFVSNNIKYYKCDKY